MATTNQLLTLFIAVWGNSLPEPPKWLFSSQVLLCMPVKTVLPEKSSVLLQYIYELLRRAWFPPPPLQNGIPIAVLANIWNVLLYLSLVLFGWITWCNKLVITVSNFYYPLFKNDFSTRTGRLSVSFGEYSGLVNLKQCILLNWQTNSPKVKVLLCK